MPTIELPDAQWNLLLDAFAARLNSGYLRLYDAVDTLAVELRFAAPAFTASVAGVATAAAIAAAGGAATVAAATVARLYESDGVTLAATGTVGTAGSGANVILNSTAIQQGVDVLASSVTLRRPAAA